MKEKLNDKKNKGEEKNQPEFNNYIYKDPEGNKYIYT